MLGNRAHGIIADACGNREAHPGGIAEEGVKSTVAAIIQVHIGAAVVREDEVADGVGTLNRERVVVEGLDEPRILCGNEFTRFRIGPELMPRQYGMFMHIGLRGGGRHIPYTRSHRGGQYKTAVHPSTAQVSSR